MDGGNGLVHGQEDGNKTGRHGQSSRGWLVGWLVGWLDERNEDMDYCLSTLAVHVQCELNCFLEKQ